MGWLHFLLKPYLSVFFQIQTGRLLTSDYGGTSTASSCLETLLPRGHVHIITASCRPVELGGSVSVSDSCMLGSAPAPAAYLFLADSLHELRDHLGSASCNHNRWYPAVWTVVMSCSAVHTHLRVETAWQAFAILWQYAVFNSAFLIGEDVYRADPFMEANRCGREAVEVYRANCSHRMHHELTTFPNCDFHVSARDSFPYSFKKKGAYIGSDVKLARLIASTSGLKINWSSRPSPQSTNSGTEAHAYYENVSRNEIDLAIGGPVISYSYFFNVTYGFSHSTMYLQFYVAEGRVVLGWRRLVGMFSIWLWAVVLISICLSVTVLSFFGPDGISHYFLMVFGILLQVPMKLPSGKLRVILLGVVFPFHWLSFMYTTYLHSFTMNPPIYSDINSVNDIISRNVTVMISGTNDLITSKVSTRLVRMALANTIPSPNFKQSAKLLNENRNFVLLERDLAMQYLISKKGYKIHSIPYKVTPLMIGLVFSKGSVFKKRIQNIIVRCVESGLCDLWIKEFLGTVSKTGKSLTTRPIIMDDVDSAFTILAIGLFIAMIVFLMEIVVHNIINQNTNKFNPWSLEVLEEKIVI